MQQDISITRILDTLISAGPLDRISPPKVLDGPENKNFTISRMLLDNNIKTLEPGNLIPMKTLLIHPKLEHYFYNEIKYPPLGIAYIAGSLRKANYPDIRILDTSIAKNAKIEIENVIKEFSPDIAGISVTTPLAKASLEVAGIIKSINKNIIVIFGGFHPTLFPAEMLKDNSVDYVVFGEGEETIVDLLDCIQKRQPPKDTAGVGYKDGNNIIINQKRPPIENLDNLPLPAYDLFEFNKYSGPQISKTPFASMFTSRGCPYRCIFCDSHVLMGRKYRGYSAERIVEEIKYLIKNFNIKEIIFKDGEFVFDRERTERFCDLLDKEKIRIAWSCNSRVGKLDMVLLKKLKRAGCRLIQFGVESGDQKILDTLKKGITIPEVIETFKMARQAGIKAVANFMIGNPGETHESTAKTLALAKRIRADQLNISILVPRPGTELFDLAKKHNWLLENTGSYDFKIDSCIMNATSISVEEVKKAYKYLFRAFYLRPSYILKRIFTFSLYEWKMNIRWFLRIVFFNKSVG